MEPKEKDSKTIFYFLLHFVLINCIWIVPALVLFPQGSLLQLLFFSFLVSYTYLSKLKYFEKKSVTLQTIATLISGLYWVTVIIFLGITGVATYEGIVNLFGLTGGHKWFAGIFAIGIPLALFVITMFIKERKTPSLILGAFVLYLLFDSMTALPYNFLFFYEHLNTASNVELDKKNLLVVINQCDSIFRPKYKIATDARIKIRSKIQNEETEDNENKKKGKEYDENNLEKKLEGKHPISEEEYQRQRNNIIKKYRPKYIKKSDNENNIFSNSLADSIKYKGLIDTLQMCKKRYQMLNNIINTDSASKLSNEIKMDLKSVCNGSMDTTLTKVAKLLDPNKLSALQSIKQLYIFIGNKSMGEATISTGDSNQSYDEDTGMLITMSLSSSLVIDILPLLLSLLYAKFKRDD